MTTPQEAIASYIAARGYHDGFHPEDFAIRQVVKLQEELGELAQTLRVDNHCFRMIEYAREVARHEFDHPRTYVTDEPTLDYERAEQELADLQVVIFALADQIGHLSGYPFDVVEAALRKAEQDVERGVR